MIKRYNQFVKGVNEEFEMGEGPPTTTPDTPTRPRPTRPGITPTEVPSEEDAPLAYGQGSDLPEEEGGEYMGQKMMADLASELDTEIGSDGSINYNGKKVNFYSETEMFHVDKKKFKTLEEVVDYLEGSSSQTDLSLDGEIHSGKRNPSRESEMDEDDMSLWNKNNPHAPSKEDMDELMDAHDDDDFIEEEEFESKSYKRTLESYKRKKYCCKI